MRLVISGVLMLGVLLGSDPEAWGSPDQGWKAVGLKGELSATSRTQYFHLYEAYTDYGLPWSLRGDAGWGVATEVEGSLGALHAAGKTGILGSLGPTIVFDKGGKGGALRIGAALYGTSRHAYGTVDLNGTLLFAGHVDLLYRFACGMGIGYRFQHISNGGLGVGGQSETNTGLDLHVLDLSWNFP